MKKLIQMNYKMNYKYFFYHLSLALWIWIKHYSLEIYILIHRFCEYVNFLKQSGFRDVIAYSSSKEIILIIQTDSSFSSSYYDTK